MDVDLDLADANNHKIIILKKITAQAQGLDGDMKWLKCDPVLS
jgi:hypothetical protein